MPMNRWIVLCLVGALSAAAAAEDWSVTNITQRTYTDEPLRLPLKAPQGDFHVTLDGQPIASAVFPAQWTGDREIWVLADFEPGQKRTFALQKGAAKDAQPRVKLVADGAAWVLDNGKVAVRVGGDGAAPAPIAAVRVGGKWIGSGRWQTKLKPIACKATVLADGSPFARVRLHYTFEGKAGLSGDIQPFATVDVTLYPGWPMALIEEHHEMTRGSAWLLDVTDGFGATQAYLQPYSSGAGGGGPNRGGVQPLKQGTVPHQPDDLLLNLFPRWNQHYKDGWFAAAVNETDLVGALVVRASKWYWMHDNAIEALVPAAGKMALRCPTWRGTRYWMLLTGAADLAGSERQLAIAYGYEAFNTIVEAIPVREWAGAKGSFRGYFPLQSGINPTGGWRGMGRAAVRDAGKLANDLGTLTHAQWLMHPDVYGSYWLFHSSENPNFFTDYIKVPVAMVARLREHPQFETLRQMAEQKLREDLYHSVTLPGGAGQECPGYLGHAIHQWEALAPMCRQYLGFDPSQWPRYKAAQDFLLHASQPIAPGQRRCHPGGDTHPTGPKIDGSVKGFVTEELPGFGIIFRNEAGTDDETYLAFKSGPNRGHYHGDQLSFHYCAKARQVAIDHMCSYSPRAGQEHMHNRVSFGTDKMPWANMDGYERVIAFQPGKQVDIAVGQVESPRLREMVKLPPEQWHQEYPQVQFDEPLTYRRTIVQVKNGGGEDYFVIRDQYDAAEGVKATYNLHVLTGSKKREGNTIRFGNLTLFVAEPRAFAYDDLDWSYSKGSGGFGEATKGIRLTAAGSKGQFITVLHPGKMPAVEAIESGVKVGNDEIVFAGGIDDVDSQTYVTVRRGGQQVAALTGKDIDMNRSQGEIGIFVPDAGYPFGPIPEWLARQRLAVPDYAPDWAKDIRGRKQ